MLTGEQIRAARALMRMEQAALGALAEVSLPTIKRLEATVGPISANTGTEARVRKALDSVGVVFLDETSTDGPGVRLRKASGPS